MNRWKNRKKKIKLNKLWVFADKLDIVYEYFFLVCYLHIFEKKYYRLMFTTKQAVYVC